MTPTKPLVGMDVSPAHTADSRGVALGLRVRSTTIDGARTSYVDVGAGPVVLLLHGAPVTSLGFVRVIHELSPTNRVIAPDLPGFGGSELPHGFGGSLDEYANFVVAFVNALGLSDLVMYINDSSGCIGLAAGTRLARRALKGVVVASTVPLPLTGAAWFVSLVLKYVVSSRVMRWLNRRFNLLPWLVATVAPWLRPFERTERLALTRDFDTHDKRERALDLFEQMAVDKTFMRRSSPRVHRCRDGRAISYPSRASSRMTWCWSLTRGRTAVPTAA
jgi:pimeloyl-ACP methyl ester carboxylesterase